MGVFDFLGGGEKPRDAAVFGLACELHPYSLKANVNDYLDLEIDLENFTGDQAANNEFTSITVALAKGLGVDRSAISQTREIRLGQLKAGEKRHFKVSVWATQRTDAGSYLAVIKAIQHDRDYSHVKNAALKRLTIRVD
jgi:phage tail tube protein FII